MILLLSTVRNALSVTQTPAQVMHRVKETHFSGARQDKGLHPLFLCILVLSSGCLSRGCSLLLGKLLGAPAWENLWFVQRESLHPIFTNYLVFKM
jgi:hypothetical protein